MKKEDGAVIVTGLALLAVFGLPGDLVSRIRPREGILAFFLSDWAFHLGGLALFTFVLGWDMEKREKNPFPYLFIGAVSLAYALFVEIIQIFIPRRSFDLKDLFFDTLGIEFSPFGRIRGRLKVGYKYFDSLAATKADFEGWVGDTSLSVRLARPLALRVSLRRDVHFSLWYENTFFIENFGSAGASLYFWRLRLDYDYSQGQNRYPGSRQPLEAEAASYANRRDDFIMHSLGLYFRLKRNLAVGVVGQRWSRDSNLPWEDDTRDFFGLNLTFDF